jgi:putative exosortase-associated protein (TIGR04073 family)
VAEGFDGFEEVVEFDGFDEVGVGADLVSAVDIGFFAGGSKDGNGEALDAGLPADPGDDFEAVPAGHFEIEQDETGERKFGAVRIGTRAGEIGDGVLAVFHMLDGIGKLGLAESALEEEDVVLIIFGHEDGAVRDACHSVSFRKREVCANEFMYYAGARSGGQGFCGREASTDADNFISRFSRRSGGREKFQGDIGKGFTTGKIGLRWSITIHFMRNTVCLLGALALVALMGAGCAGPEQKFGRGLGNTTEIVRGGEFQRGMEQGNLFAGPDTGFTTGFMQGFDKTMARTGVGIYEIVTFPLPPYHPVCTDYLSARPGYPDSYQPRKWAEPFLDTDHYVGFSGGDIAPWFPGSHFTVFDN